MCHKIRHDRGVRVAIVTLVCALAFASMVQAQMVDACSTDADCDWLGSPVGGECNEYDRCGMTKTACVTGDSGFRVCRPTGAYCPTCKIGPAGVALSTGGQPTRLGDGDIAVVLTLDGVQFPPSPFPDGEPTEPSPLSFWTIRLSTSSGELLSDGSPGTSITVELDSNGRTTATLIAPATSKPTIRATSVATGGIMGALQVDMVALSPLAGHAVIRYFRDAESQDFFRTAFGAINVSADPLPVVVTATSPDGVPTRRVVVVGPASMAALPRTNFWSDTPTDYQGVVTVEGLGLNLTREGSTDCAHSIEPASWPAPARGGRRSFRVRASACPWSVSTETPWISLTGRLTGVEDGRVSLDVANNPTAIAREGRVRIGSAEYVVTQDGAPAVAGTYPRFLAEGATAASFDTQLAILNPGNTGTTATLRFLPGAGGLIFKVVPVPARTRVTVNAKDVPGLATAEFSTVVEADQPLVVDRTMSWDASGYGSHAETAIAAPATTWYLAEGATHSGFSLFYLLQNPSASATTVRVRYLRGAGEPLEKTYDLAPQSRTNIWVNIEEFPGLGRALASAEISAVIESLDATPIIVERAMYLSNQGRNFNAGHESMGVTAPSTTWFLAEGATGEYFDEFVLIANPTDTDAAVTVSYLLGDGTTYSRTLVAPANARSGIWVDHEEFEGVPGRPLADVAVSTTITSTNDVPLVVERAMWWPGNGAGWHEAHNSAGATTTGTQWALAEGEVGGPRAIETYILIANTSTYAGNAEVTLLFEDGTSQTRTYPLAPRSRTNVAVANDFGVAVRGRRFGAVVTSTGSTPAQIVVERAMYSSTSTVGWAAGTNALATRLQ